MNRLRIWATLAVAACTPAAPATAREYFVDYAHGTDDAAGSATAPWKHAPGDPAARGRAAAATLGPGDVVRFKAGVAYRGTIVVRSSGTAERPIVFTGSGYGTGPGVIDGADPAVSVVACESAAACGGVPNWQGLSLVRFTPAATGEMQLYDTDGPLIESQSPAPADSFYADDVEGWTSTPRADAGRIEQGRLRAPDLARTRGPGPGGDLLFWVRGNETVRRPITGVDGNDLLYDAARLDLYDDRDGRFAVVGSARLPAPPHSFVILGPGVAVASLGTQREVLVGSGRRGFLIQAASHVVVRDLRFVRQTSARGQIDQGIAIEARKAPIADIRIENNAFGPAMMRSHQGMIRLTNVRGARIAGNRFAAIGEGSGIRTGGDNDAVIVEGNGFNRIGRTAIAFFGVSHGSIAGNVIDDARGLHGNGISLYLSNRGVTVANNRVTNTTRPMTIRGDRVPLEQPGDHDFVIERNVFVSTPAGQAALTSWGAQTRGVTIRHNYLAGGRVGLLLNGTDRRVVVSDNLLTGVVVSNPDPSAGWTVGANQTIRPRPGAAPDIAAACGALSLPTATPLGTTAC